MQMPLLITSVPPLVGKASVQPPAVWNPLKLGLEFIAGNLWHLMRRLTVSKITRPRTASAVWWQTQSNTMLELLTFVLCDKSERETMFLGHTSSRTTRTCLKFLFWSDLSLHFHTMNAWYLSRELFQKATNAECFFPLPAPAKPPSSKDLKTRWEVIDQRERISFFFLQDKTCLRFCRGIHMEVAYMNKRPTWRSLAQIFVFASASR